MLSECYTTPARHATCHANASNSQSVCALLMTKPELETSFAGEAELAKNPAQTMHCSLLIPELGTHCFAELAGDAALLSCGISPQYVLPSEARADLSLLERVVDLQIQPCAKSHAG